MWMRMEQTRQAQAVRVDVMGYISWARRAAPLAAARPQRLLVCVDPWLCNSLRSGCHPRVGAAVAVVSGRQLGRSHRSTPRPGEGSPGRALLRSARPCPALAGRGSCAKPFVLGPMCAPGAWPLYKSVLRLRAAGTACACCGSRPRGPAAWSAAQLLNRFGRRAQAAFKQQCFLGLLKQVNLMGCGACGCAAVGRGSAAGLGRQCAGQSRASSPRVCCARPQFWGASRRSFCCVERAAGPAHCMHICSTTGTNPIS